MARRHHAIPAGLRNRRIQIDRLTVTRDAYGSPVNTWRPWAQRWAYIQPVRGNELMEGQNLTEKQFVRMQFEYTSDLKAKDRISIEQETYNIREIIDVGSAHVTTEVLTERLP